MLDLPDDVLLHISTLLSNKEKKILRLTNKRLHAFNLLHIRRVFISPSYKNIEVFLAVAAHPVFSKKVKEIVWDDARFEKFEPNDEEDDLLPEERVRNKLDFERAREENLVLVRGSEQRFIQARAGGFERVSAEALITDNAPESYLSLEESFDMYSRMYDEQEIIIRDALDVEAFKKGLVAFTELERVTVTSEAYRPSIINPCYLTPLIRSFPLGHNYPGPWPWMPETYDEPYRDLSPSDIRTHWRGVTLTLDALAQCERLIPEFIIDTRFEQTGVAYQLFDHPSDDLCNLQMLCERGLRRLDLAINTFSTFQNPGLRQLPRGQLRAVLATASALEHFSLHVSAGEKPADNLYRIEDEIMDALRVVPLEAWPRLKHITISSLPVVYTDLVAFLHRLPSTIQSVRLVNVDFTESTFKALLEHCRDEMHWTGANPTLVVGHQQGGKFDWRKLWADHDIAAFFRGAHNPFDGKFSGNYIQRGFGVVRDDFYDTFSRPNIPDPAVYICLAPGVYRPKTKDDVAEEQRQLQLQQQGGENSS